jgi:hypothetical protein
MDFETQPIHIRFEYFEDDDEGVNVNNETKNAQSQLQSISSSPTNKLKTTTNFTISQYFEEYQYKIHKYKLAELKEISGLCKIKGAKTKTQYVTKIHDYFVKSLHAIKIQRICRGFFVRFFFKIKGGGASYKLRNLCINETDFYTMDPLSNIGFNEYFPFLDEDNFSYGFNICSLISMYEKNSHFVNPYNRKPFPLNDIQSFSSLAHFIQRKFNLCYSFFHSEQKTDCKIIWR